MSTLDREKARANLLGMGLRGSGLDDLLGALEDCVESDGWPAIMRILSTYYPESIFPQRSVDADWGNGPQVVSLLRLLNAAESKLRRIRASLDAYLDHRQSIDDLTVSVGVILGPPAEVSS